MCRDRALCVAIGQHPLDGRDRWRPMMADGARWFSHSSDTAEPCDRGRLCAQRRVRRGDEGEVARMQRRGASIFAEPNAINPGSAYPRMRFPGFRVRTS